MWRLESFDKDSGMIVKGYILRGISGPKLKELLNLDDSEYPVEAAQHDVPPEKLGELAEYISEPFIPDDSLDYEVGFTSD
ncbi:DUF7683 domain-containing protein [Nocardia sp. R7R-8]|uniref:DUF7683 domain-containing protein n=1 Tax=Nocardia sp. R7R-8 TaxID=3459304 RepID=UPI00403E2CA0